MLKKIVKVSSSLAFAALFVVTLNGCGTNADKNEEAKQQVVTSSSDTQSLSISEDTNNLHQENQLSESNVNTNATANAYDDKVTSITMNVNGETFTIELADTETAVAFASNMPLEVVLQDLNNNEKFVYLPDNLPENRYSPGEIKAGDVMLYGSNCLVVFYKSHATSYSYSRIGTIKDISNLDIALANPEVTASFL